MHGISTRTIATLVLVGALVLSAGCSGIGIGERNTDTTETVDTQATDEPTESSDPTSTTSDGSSSSTGDDGVTATETEERDSGDGHDGHDHDHGDDNSDGSDGDSNDDNEDSNERDSNNGDSNNDGDQNDNNDDSEQTEDDTEGDIGELNRSTAEVDGRMLIAVDGEQLDLTARDESGDKFGMEGGGLGYWLGAEAGMTLSEALTYFNITAESSQLTVDGEQYSEANEGTNITYRVDWKSVDPENHTLKNYHEIWIVVETADMNVSSPGEYIKEEEFHAHGDMTFVVDGHEVDFTKEYYQSATHRYFHFENEKPYWHAHTWSITLEDALSYIEGINANGDSIYFKGPSDDEGTSYDDSDQGTTITFRVNGESVDPGEYILKDGDDVHVEIDSEQGS